MELNLHNGSVSYRSIAFVVISLALTLFSACTTKPQYASPVSFLPTLKYEINYFAGSPKLAFAPTETESLRAEDSLAVTVSIFAARQLPGDLLAPIESRVRLIKVFPSDEIVAPMVRLTKGTRAGSVEDAERFISNLTDNEHEGAVLLKKFYGVLPPEITASFNLIESNQLDTRLPEGIKIQLCRCSTNYALKDELVSLQSLEIAIAATGRIKQKTVLNNESSMVEGDGQENELLDHQNEYLQLTETIFLKPRQFETQDQFAVILPAPFETEETIKLAVAVEVRPPPPDEDRMASSMHAWAFNECKTHFTGENIIENEPDKERIDTEWPGFENAIQALRSFPTQRRVLLYLAERTGASLTEDMVLSGSDMLIGRLSGALINEYSSGSITGSTSLGWTLERTSYGILATILSSDQTTPELEAILIRHAGQVGRHISTLEELTARAGSIDEFQRYLVRENFIYLEDISPAARTRAFEWLKARGQAPDGYDPLAPLQERRDVLRNIEKSIDL